MGKVARRIHVPQLTNTVYRQGRKTVRNELLDVVRACCNRKTDALTSSRSKDGDPDEMWHEALASRVGEKGNSHSTHTFCSITAPWNNASYALRRRRARR